MSKLKLALEKAKELRESHGKDVGTSKGWKSVNRKKNTIQFTDEESAKLEVSYSRTKVQQVDRDIFRKNKIYALFKDNSTNDQIEILRTQILQKLKKGNGNTILVTSANPGEGKTFISINLGVSIAQQMDRTALIVDTDLRQPWKHHKSFSDDFWGIKVEKGLSDYFAGKAEIEEIMISPGIDKLTIIPGGDYISNSADHLASSKMEKLVKQLKTRYKERIVIFDSAAVLKHPDPIVFSQHIDGVVLVVEAEKTRPDEIKKVASLLKDSNILGCVYNKSKEK